MTTSITLENCGKSFAQARILAPANLTINAGETLVFLGPSGCGKTTLLRMIAGLEFPDPGGRVLFGARDVTKVPIENRNVGMVFQSYALFPNMNVAENIGYGLKLRGMAKPARHARVEQMLEMMRIQDLRNRNISQLSGGQRQRVALARAVAAQPDVLLLDEPLTALDAKLRETLRVEIDTLLRQLGITTVYVTHDQAEAMALADRLVVMQKGRIKQIGTPREIWFNPADHFVAEFIGATCSLPGFIENGVLSVSGLRALWNAPDGPVRVMLRPHALRLAGPADGLAVLVQAAQFVGDRTRVTIALPDGSQVSLDTEPDTRTLPGDILHIAADPAALIVMPEGTPV
ncbi:ABC transporter ATP-binding protein [Acidocella aminolytica]|uniref:ABC transporter Fe3+ transport fbpC n=1 Tax=Acidocella aminolytica 101 = DSM 11237 TaxID=1120923 RepID=A0A0D6PGJ5_9PROT|nr:ABC transporter ATP-binding protein [Acidocella aminolytica]GAN80767.1 ABC transporter Fe3+ transport fbpC [Acidocella aminolytica 101 = DSM 11237]GBQ36514.1 nitrate/sulfonate/bicarbonate transporter ATP-binding protein [Acidocella aminolytica 101 = DSM 11237]SHF51801.1 putative spermidine/putrescine transport system ATP-binding protein [Acidocella aminolytica 101 = DSM 11237]